MTTRVDSSIQSFKFASSVSSKEDFITYVKSLKSIFDTNYTEKNLGPETHFEFNFSVLGSPEKRHKVGLTFIKGVFKKEDEEKFIGNLFKNIALDVHSILNNDYKEKSKL